MDLFWLKHIADSWLERARQGRLPHAVLLIGPAGVGKRSAAASGIPHCSATSAQVAAPDDSAEKRSTVNAAANAWLFLNENASSFRRSVLTARSGNSLAVSVITCSQCLIGTQRVSDAKGVLIPWRLKYPGDSHTRGFTHTCAAGATVPTILGWPYFRLA